MPAVTRLLSDTRRDQVIERLHRHFAQGRQAYWVCPLIEESEALQLQTAIATHEGLARQFPEFTIGLVHGRLTQPERSRIMDAFQLGEINLLVATTVVEVGLDVPNASLMVIEHAERMGLSQLHQLRGRVGRGALASDCILPESAFAERAGAVAHHIREHGWIRDRETRSAPARPR
jgi:ATP-dependent DNA helicase RecG